MNHAKSLWLKTCSCPYSFCDHELGTDSGRVFVCHVAVAKQSLVLILWLGTSKKQLVSFSLPSSLPLLSSPLFFLTSPISF